MSLMTGILHRLFVDAALFTLLAGYACVLALRSNVMEVLRYLDAVLPGNGPQHSWNFFMKGCRRVYCLFKSHMMFCILQGSSPTEHQLISQVVVVLFTYM